MKLPAFKAVMPKLALPKGGRPLLPPKLFALRASTSVLTAELDGGWLKLALSEEKGAKRALTAVWAEPTDGAGELELALKVQKFLKEKAVKPDLVLISHPAHELTLRVLSLPSKDPKEIRDIVDLQAVKQTPYAREEITVGFQILETDASGYSRVLIAVAHRDSVQRGMRTLELAGLTPSRITFSLEGAFSWLEAAKALAPDAAGMTLLLNVDASTTDLVLLKGGHTVFVRSLNFGAKHFAENPSGTESEFVLEVQRTIDSASQEEQPVGRPDQAVVTGAKGVIKNLAAAISREMNLPCEVLGSFQPFEDRKEIPAGFEKPQEEGLSYLSVTGLALRPHAQTANLMPPDMQMRRNLQARARDLAFFGTLMLALVFLFSMIGIEKVFKRSSYLASLEKSYAEMRSQTEEVERIVSKMKLASGQLAGGGGFLDVLADLGAALPASITLTGVQYQEKEKLVTLRGLSQEMSAIFQFLSTLEATPQLEFVKTRNVTKRKVEEREVAEFEIVAGLAGGGPGAS